jgi:hypothetical protein
VEQFLLERIGKPLLMFVIAFFAVKYITGSAGDGVLVGLIPLVLGLIGILQSLGYALTAFTVIVAVVFGLMTPNAKLHVRQAFLKFGDTLENGLDDSKTGAADNSKPAPAPATQGSSSPVSPAAPASDNTAKPH